MELEISPIGGDKIPTIMSVIPAKKSPITVIWQISKNEYFLRNDILINYYFLIILKKGNITEISPLHCFQDAIVLNYFPEIVGNAVQM